MTRTRSESSLSDLLAASAAAAQEEEREMQFYNVELNDGTSFSLFDIKGLKLSYEDAGAIMEILQAFGAGGMLGHLMSASVRRDVRHHRHRSRATTGPSAAEDHTPPAAGARGTMEISEHDLNALRSLSVSTQKALELIIGSEAV